MTITTGDTLPAATLLRMGETGPEPVSVTDLAKGRKIVIFGLPGAYTGTCSTAHVPSFIRSHDGLKQKGVDEVICVSVNDPFVMLAWGKDTGGIDAGITFLGDPMSEFTKAIGMAFTAEPAGFLDRSQRYSMVVEDGTVTILNAGDKPGECNLSAGETLLDQL